MDSGMLDEFLSTSGDVAQSVGTGLAWFITINLLFAGAVGCVFPLIPGHLIILIAAIAHWAMLRGSSGMHWWSFAVLLLLMAISQVFEMLSGAAGSRWFGGSRWGAVGAVLGSIAGFFFFPIGLLLGPLIGAFLLEIAFARKQARPAVVSGVGSVVGVVAGMGFKIVIGALMILWFFLDVFLIGK